MANERLSMRKVREILRQKLCLGRSHREVALHVGVSVGVVTKVLGRAQEAGIDWPTASSMDEDELERRLYPGAAPSSSRLAPDPVWIHTERKKAGVTLELLHIEYLAEHPDGYQYTAFCEHYRRWLKRRKLSMRQVHLAGDKLFVDYSGKKPRIVDVTTGDRVAVDLFVAVLGASNMTYAEATATQRGPDFIASHIRTYEYFGGVPALNVPDQLKSGVTTSCIYDPAIQRTYEEMARHYDTAVMPARPRKPKDKSKVEVGVQVVQRWVLARLRNEVFTSLPALNARIRELVEELNDRSMKGYGGKTRRELFEAIDRPALRPLPPERFDYADWESARVDIDYHVKVDGHFYSVPYTLVRELVDIRLGASTVEVSLRGRRVAAHKRSFVEGGPTTVKEHMPKAHQESLQWPPSRLIAWAQKVGPHVEQMVCTILAERPHPEQGYRTCIGVLHLAKHYGDERLDKACERALKSGARSYRHVKAILKNNLDRVSLDDEDTDEMRAPIIHENVRGPGYYH